MASKAIYSVVAVAGMVVASGAAYWFQNKPKGPQEMGAATAGATPPAAAASAGGARGSGGPAGVEVAKVEVTKLQDDAQSVGTLRSRQNVMLRPEVAGRVQSLGFSDGARVRKGDVLVQLDDVLQRAEVRQAQAQVSIASANLKRNQELVAQNFVAQRVLDEAAANLQVVEAQMALSCARWERMRIVAPFDGTAGIRNVNLGDYVKDGADLVNIEDLSSMYVDFKLPERFQGKLRRDQQVEMQLDAMPGRIFKAKIEAIDPQIDANGRSVSIRASLPNSGGEPLVQRAAPASATASAPRAGASAAQEGKPVVPAPAAGKPVAKPAMRAAAAAGATPRPIDSTAAACAANNATARSPMSGVSNAVGPRSSASAAATMGQRPAWATSANGGAGRAIAAGQGGKPSTTGAGAGSGAGPLRPGMFARVTTVFNIKDKSLTVPEEAIVPQAGKQFVIKVVTQTEEQAKTIAEAVKVAAAAAAASAAAAGTSAPVSNAPPAQPPVFVDGKRLVSQRVEVKIGIRRPGRVELTEGVEEGETVVVAGQQRLQRDNTPVRIVDLGRPTGGSPSASGAATGSAAPANAATGVVSAPPTANAASASR
jgi:RND family efflux transporter MFP subunit